MVSTHYGSRGLLSQHTQDQLARYDTVLGARLLIGDNGETRYGFRRATDGWEFLEDVPVYAAD